jgi:hypothetical protein
MKTNIEIIEDYILESESTKHSKKHPPVCIDHSISGTGVEEVYDDATPESLTLPLRFAFVNRHPEENGKFSVQSWTSGNRKDFRSIPFGRFQIKWETLFSGQLVIPIRLISNNGKSWRAFNPLGHDISDEVADGGGSIINFPGAVIGMQCFTEYCWTVEFFFTNGSSPIYLTAGDDLLEELMRSRDLPAGKHKRDRVIHSVLSHKRSGSTTVRKHMRGFVTHAWNGCMLKVKPPVNEVIHLPDTKKGNEIKDLVLSR